MNNKSDYIKKLVFERPGYSLDLVLESEELNFFRKEIEAQWLREMTKVDPRNQEQFRTNGIKNYHKVSRFIDHNAVWNKSNRLLPQETVQQIKKLNFMNKLREIFGNFKISDIAYDNEIKKDQEEIYWRLVRPEVDSDVGPLHTDKWFHEILELDKKIFTDSYSTVKIWIPIYCEPGKNGLLIVPNSHNKKWKYSKKLVNGIPKPIFEDVANPILLNTKPGNLVIFNENLLHAGSKNKGNETRVSVEITIAFYK